MMRRKKMKRFPGVYVAIVTPFTEEMEVDYTRLREHANWLIENGVHGIIPMGTVGEYATLTDEERGKVVETIVEVTAGRVPVVVGTGSPSTKKAVHWAEHAKQVGASGIMALPPINYNPTRHEVIAFYKTLSEVGLPIIAYNNPFDTKVDLVPDLLAELCQIENFVAIKEFSGDIRRIHEIYEKTNLEVLAGADDLSLEALLAGATGWIAGFVNSYPKESVKLFELATSGKVAEATKLYRRLLPLFRYDSTPRLVQSIKYSLELVGKPVGLARAPRLELTQEEKASIEQVSKLI
jgi:4-hydroxy-tetrahydrodipicolinate synthase